MAKRYSDNGKWSDNWFSELPVEYKLAYIYILDQCDTVGVWKPNYRLAEFQLGTKIDWENFKSTCGENRVFAMKNGYWWIVKFCDFQYSKINEFSKSPPIISYVELLKKHGLWEQYKNHAFIEPDNAETELTPDQLPQLKRTILPAYVAPVAEGTHTDFAKKIMSVECELDRNAIGVTCKKVLTADVVKRFNAHCVNQTKVHLTFDKWKSHLASWYNLQKVEVKTPTKYKELTDE